MKRRDMLIGACAFSVAFRSIPSFSKTPVDGLLEPGPLPEMSFGRQDAPVTVIEYASLTCPHCRSFHMTTWPTVRANYVDAGKLRFIMREFPLDPRSAAAFMLARCAGPEIWYATIDLLYRAQVQWARGDDPIAAFKSVLGVTGMAAAEIEACISDQQLLDKINAVAARGKEFGVNSTPTFFFNGEIRRGALTVKEFSKIVDPLIGGTK